MIISTQPNTIITVFNQLTNFGYIRSWKEAVGFYIAYLVLTMLISALISGVAGNLLLPATADFSEGFNLGLRIGPFVAAVVTLVLSFLILSKKRLMSNFGLILLAIVTGILGFWGGGLLGLIPTAYLTTRKINQ